MFQKVKVWLLLCGDDTGSYHSTGTDHQRRCKKYFNWCSEHYRKGDKGQADGRI